METAPTSEEHQEARKWPGGYIYRIADGFDPDGHVPPEAINGAWKVDDRGRIEGEFIPNDKFDPKCRPPS